jgi:hypothetical protein
METVEVELRFRNIGPCPAGFIWLDTHTGRYQEYGPDVDPNCRRSPEDARKKVDYRAGWHSR